MMRTMHRRFSIPWASGVAALLLGCGMGTEQERAYFAARDAERMEREEMKRTLTATVPDGELLDLVRGQPSPNGVGTMMDWVNWRATELKGQVLFPRWQVTRRGSSKYEVRYSFTWIDTTNHISSRGFVWTVDGGLKLVGEPREMAAQDLAPRARSFTEQQERRVRDESYSLE
jgi:hypothetical protein